MEVTFSKLRAKEVVNTQDGKKLGRICDIVLCYPENRWIGIVVPGSRGFSMKKSEFFIDLKHIVKIGEDVILVNVGCPKRGGDRETCPPPPPVGRHDNHANPFIDKRNFDEYE